MEYVNIPFPDCIAFGAQSDAMWSTELAAVLSGREVANQNWQDARHAFDASQSVKTASDFAQVREHFHQVNGRAKSFPFRDFIDFEVTQANGRLLTLAGAVPSADGTYYLHKRYGSVAPYDRRITRPDNPAQVFRTRGGTTTDITGSGAAITYTTGAVAITGHVGGDTYSWAGTFVVPCRYDTDRLSASAINRSDDELLVQCGPVPLVEVRE